MTVSSALSGIKGLVCRTACVRDLCGNVVGIAPPQPAILVSGDTLDVVVDRSRLVKMPERVATIVIGNP